MYQPLIWPLVAGDDAGGLRPALNPKGLKGAPDALVDGVRRDTELNGDFLGGKVLIDQQQTVQLATRESCDPLRHCRLFVVRIA